MTPAPKRARGLTLLEVLIATALLAVMAAACVPVMAQAMRALQREEHADLVDTTDLARLADAVLAHPDLIGFKQPDEILMADGTEFPWPDDVLPDRVTSAPPVRIKVLHNSETKVDHAWLVFESGAVVVHRWLAVPAAIESPNP